jgi:hypothetical protein
MKSGPLGSLLTKPWQHTGTGKVSIADTDLSSHCHAAIQRLRTVMVRQFQMREATAAQIEHAVEVLSQSCGVIPARGYDPEQSGSGESLGGRF